MGKSKSGISMAAARKFADARIAVQRALKTDVPRIATEQALLRKNAEAAKIVRQQQEAAASNMARLKKVEETKQLAKEKKAQDKIEQIAIDKKKAVKKEAWLLKVEAKKAKAEAFLQSMV